MRRLKNAARFIQALALGTWVGKTNRFKRFNELRRKRNANEKHDQPQSQHNPATFVDTFPKTVKEVSMDFLILCFRSEIYFNLKLICH